MANLSGISSATTAATALSNLILVSPQQTTGYQPQSSDSTQNQQPPSLLFHYEGEQTVALESDITDHYVEDNTAIQDQIALKPEVITTHGFIGELNDVPPAALQLLQQAANKLTTIGAYAPALSATALIAYDEAFLLYQVGANAVNSAVSAWSSINGSNGENVIGSSGLGTGTFNAATGQISGNQTKQQVAFQQFYGYWKSRTLFTVQTPWAIFQNMAIKSLRAIQDAETRMITDFEVSFKMIRFSYTVGVTTPILAFGGRFKNQGASLVDFGSSNIANGPTLGVNTSLTQMAASA